MRRIFVVPVVLAGLMTIPVTANADERFWSGAALGAGAGAVIAGPVGAIVGGAAGALIGGPPITPLGFYPDRAYAYAYDPVYDRECYDMAGYRIPCPPPPY